MPKSRKTPAKAEAVPQTKADELSHVHFGWCEVTKASAAFSDKVHRKNYVFHSVLLAATTWWVASRPLDDAFAPGVELPPLSAGRAAANVGLAMLILSMGYCNSRVNPPPEISKPYEDRFYVLGAIGNGAFLTYWSIAVLLQYTWWSAFAELGCRGYFDAPGLAAALALPTDLAHRALGAAYFVAPFAEGWAVALTLLWLKFNWFEKQWQEVVVVYWRSRNVSNTSRVFLLRFLLLVARTRGQPAVRLSLLLTS